MGNRVWRLLCLALIGWVGFGIAAGFVYGAAPALTLYVAPEGGTAYPAAYLTAEDLDGLTGAETVYSAVDAALLPNRITARGTALSALLELIGLSEGDVNSVYAQSSDSGSVITRYPDLFESERFYFPEILELSENGAPGDSDSDGPVPGNPGPERTPVAPMLVSGYRVVRGAADSGRWEDQSGFRLMFGQTDIREQNEPRFGKYIVSLTFVHKPGAAGLPPEATPPEDSGEPGAGGAGSAGGDGSGGESGFVGDSSSTGGGGVTKESGSADESGSAAEPGSAGESGGLGLAADSLTLTVGYFGGPYYEKAVFTAEDLAALPQVEQAYTFIDNMPAVVLESARGARLLDILAAAGIDPASVEAFHFYCTDVQDSWYVSIPKPYLLDTERYYFPRLPEAWDYDLGRASPEAREGAVAVPVIIALADDFRRFGTEADFTQLTTSTRFRLVFGQTDTETPNASRSAKWIHTIQVMLGGTPPGDGTEGAGPDILEREVGSAAGAAAPETRNGSEPGDSAPAESAEDRPVPGDTEDPAPGDSAPGAGESAPEREYAGDVYVISAAGLAGPGGVQRWRRQAMSETAAELPLIHGDNPLVIPAALCTLLCFAAGAAGRVIRFHKEKG
jgi:hypothetical protein